MTKDKTSKTSALPPASFTKGSVSENFSFRNAVVKFCASSFSGNVRDNKLTKESTEEHNINGKRLSVRKYLLQSPQLNEVVNAIQSARNYFNKNSLPWESEGERIIPSTRILDLKSTMEEKIRDIITKRDKLIDALDDIIMSDRLNLGDTFNQSDYPTKDELRAKYGARVEIRPVSTNFVVDGIEASAQKVIQAEIDKSIEETIKKTKIHQLEELASSIQHLANRLADSEKSFKANSIQNILDFSANIRDLAIVDDENMKVIANSVRDGFSKLNPETLRENPGARAEAAKMAQDELSKIREAMQGFM